MALRAAIVSIGDELMSGRVTDTNSAWIADFLLSRGIECVMHLSVGDEMERIIWALKTAGEAADLVVVSGGLGPTADDLTTEAFTRFAGVGKVLHEQALEAIKQRFKAIGREMTPNNIKQAELPQGAVMLPNPIGTAPGYYQDIGDTRYFFVPGVPRECLLMVEQQVWPAIASLEKHPTVMRAITLRTFGATESMLDMKLADIPLAAGQKLGYRAVFPEIHLKLSASGESASEVEAALAALTRAVRARVGEFIYSEDDQPLEQVIGDLLRQRGLRLAVAESCTGGLIAKRITDVPGSSDYFERGFVTYSNRAKTELLGVEAELIAAKGAVSKEVAMAMAEGARKRASVDIALAVTGIAGPAGGTAEKPVGSVHIALSHQGGTLHFPFMFPRPDRAFIRELTAEAGLETLRRFILRIPAAGG